MVNETLIPIALEPLTNTISAFTKYVSAAIGGMFGLYLILVILKWRESVQLKRITRSVHSELVKLNERIEIIEDKYLRPEPKEQNMIRNNPFKQLDIKPIKKKAKTKPKTKTTKAKTKPKAKTTKAKNKPKTKTKNSKKR